MQGQTGEDYSRYTSDKSVSPIISSDPSRRGPGFQYVCNNEDESLEGLILCHVVRPTHWYRLQRYCCETNMCVPLSRSVSLSSQMMKVVLPAPCDFTADILGTHICSISFERHGLHISYLHPNPKSQSITWLQDEDQADDM